MSSTNRGAIRHDADFYRTPERSVHALLDRVDLSDRNFGQWLEPAVGDGAIIKAFDSHSSDLDPRWLSLDIHDRGMSEFSTFTQQDYLSYVPAAPVEVIITNPPFGIAQDFVSHSLSIANGAVVIMLLRLGFLGSKKRRDWWQGKEPDALYVLSERPTGRGGDSCDYAWYCWNWDERGIFVI